MVGEDGVGGRVTGKTYHRNWRTEGREPGYPSRLGPSFLPDRRDTDE